MLDFRLLPTPLIEANLLVLYATTDLDDRHRATRYALATEYHERTGKFFAARFY